MSPIDEQLADTNRRIGEAYKRLSDDLVKLRQQHKDWGWLDLEKRVRWAQYTLEVADLERQKLHIRRTLEQVANVSPPEAFQSING